VSIGGAGSLALSQSNEVQSPRSPSFSRTSFNSSEIGSGSLTAGGHGRGGAGNYAAIDEAERVARQIKEEQERVKAEKTRQRIEAEVDALVKMPEGAWVSQGRIRDT